MGEEGGISSLLVCHLHYCPFLQSSQSTYINSFLLCSLVFSSSTIRQFPRLDCPDSICSITHTNNEVHYYLIFCPNLYPQVKDVIVEF